MLSLPRAIFYFGKVSVYLRRKRSPLLVTGSGLNYQTITLLTMVFLFNLTLGIIITSHSSGEQRTQPLNSIVMPMGRKDIIMKRAILLWALAIIFAFVTVYSLIISWDRKGTIILNQKRLDIYERIYFDKFGLPGDVWIVNDGGNLEPLGIDYTGVRKTKVTNWGVRYDILTIAGHPVEAQTHGDKEYQAHDQITLIYGIDKIWREISFYRP